jgi:hypothetical protein
MPFDVSSMCLAEFLNDALVVFYLLQYASHILVGEVRRVTLPTAVRAVRDAASKEVEIGQTINML